MSQEEKTAEEIAAMIEQRMTLDAHIHVARDLAKGWDVFVFVWGDKAVEANDEAQRIADELRKTVRLKT